MKRRGLPGMLCCVGDIALPCASIYTGCACALAKAAAVTGVAAAGWNPLPGMAGAIVSGTAFDVPPPGTVVTTVICTVPGVVIMPYGTCANIVCSSKEKESGTTWPFQ